MPFPIRHQGLPEQYPFRDIGCHVWSACLTCPLAACILDDPGQFARERRAELQRAAQALRGLQVDDIAAAVGVAPRTVFRWRAAGGSGRIVA